MSDFENNNNTNLIPPPHIDTSIVDENNKINKDSHPCQYCGNPCYGKQCKQCHLKMLESQKGLCIDCNLSFHATRRDGSKRRRCMDCQTSYNKKYISECPDCKTTYHAYMEDGRVFEKCFPCYRKSLHKCTNCDNFTKFEFALCRNCYQSSSSDRKFYSSPRELQLFKCNNETCENLTSKNLCKSCYLGN